MKISQASTADRQELRLFLKNLVIQQPGLFKEILNELKEESADDNFIKAMENILETYSDVFAKLAKK